MSLVPVFVVVLAAGKGTRMNSDLPKVLHRIAGKSLIEHVLDTADQINPAKTVVIIGHKADLVRESLLGRKVEFAIQDPPMGTGHAVKCGRIVLNDASGCILVLSGDVPLLRADTISRLVDFHLTSSAACTVLSVEADNPFGYGRIVRSDTGELLRIVEEKDAADSERRIREINSGIYCFDSASLWPALDKIRPNNAKGEYYLTDTLEIIRNNFGKIQIFKTRDYDEIRGINTIEELHQAEAVLMARAEKQNS